MEIRDAKIVDVNGYKLPERTVDGFLPSTEHRREDTALKGAAKNPWAKFILRYLSEAGGDVFLVMIAADDYKAYRAANPYKKRTRY